MFNLIAAFQFVFPDVAVIADDVLMCPDWKYNLYIECGTGAAMTIDYATAGYVADTKSCRKTTQREVLIKTASEKCKVDYTEELER